MKSLLLLLVMSGCVGDYKIIPHQDKAMDVIWNQIYHMSIVPPLILWIDQPDLNCAQKGNGQYMGFLECRWFGDTGNNGVCDLGLSWYPLYISEISLPDGYTFTNNDVLPHELLHQKLGLETNDSDPNHNNPGFGVDYGHAPGGYVDQAMDALMKAGLQ